MSLSEQKTNCSRYDMIAVGKVFSVNISSQKGVKKKPVSEAYFVKDKGVLTDAHISPKDETRQVSFLALESIKKQSQKIKSPDLELVPGVFAENITLKGIKSSFVRINDIFEIEGGVVLEISRIGKECHEPCDIFHKTGDCIMPREGFFARVKKGGVVRQNAKILVLRRAEKESCLKEYEEVEVANV